MLCRCLVAATVGRAVRGRFSVGVFEFAFAFAFVATGFLSSRSAFEFDSLLVCFRRPSPKIRHQSFGVSSSRSASVSSAINLVGFPSINFWHSFLNMFCSRTFSAAI
jgi:hypothetical protein